MTDISFTPQTIVTRGSGYRIEIDRRHPLVGFSEALGEPQFYVEYHAAAVQLVEGFIRTGFSQMEALATANDCGPDHFITMTVAAAEVTSHEVH